MPRGFLPQLPVAGRLNLRDLLSVRRFCRVHLQCKLKLAKGAWEVALRLQPEFRWGKRLDQAPKENPPSLKA